MPKVYADEGGILKDSKISVPRIVDLPILIEGTNGETQAEIRPFMNCDGFAMAGAIGGEDIDDLRNVLVVQMHLGESGLFHILDMEEAELLHKRLGSLIKGLKTKDGYESYLKKSKKKEIETIARDEEVEDDA